MKGQERKPTRRNKWAWSKLIPPKVPADQTPFAGLHGSGQRRGLLLEPAGRVGCR